MSADYPNAGYWRFTAQEILPSVTRDTRGPDEVGFRGTVERTCIKARATKKWEPGSCSAKNVKGSARIKPPRLTRNVQLWPTVSYNVCPSPRLLHSTYVPSRIQPCADLILAPYEPDLERTAYRRRTAKQPNKPSAAGELTHPEIPAPTPAHDFQFSGSCLMSQGFLASDPAARLCGETLLCRQQMLPFASSGSKVTPRQHMASYSNGYPRATTFELSPHSELETVRYYDLNDVQGTARGWEREERILVCVPLRDAEQHLPMFFSHLRNFTYPHRLIDLAFLVSDSKDRTLEVLTHYMSEIQESGDPNMMFGEVSIIEKDFGQVVNQDVESRHGFAAQAPRRKLMARARNWLLSAALRPYHSWVYWRDVDVETAPYTILEDLMRHNKDVIVPNVWRPLPDWLGGEQPYDLNSWQESDTALALADTLDEDAVIVEGYAEYATWRPHLAYLRDPYGDPDMEMEIDGVGGVSILAKARVFRYGVHFPAFSFEKHAETEGFGKQMAKKMKFSVVGLPHYTIWHLYEPSVEDLKHMEQMERERLAREKEEKEKAEKAQKLKESFGDATSQWEEDKSKLQQVAIAESQKKQEDAQKAAAAGSKTGEKAEAR
ncbi:mannan polymerase II complex ANP1 subunit-like protein [Thermochaetoides thermophila DSM 1495]|uniref:Mannan polymerase II complex ANP1 subunit-like protein n=1 Tax=Chaetomium thermophilum (strain DSM 1495 / CBS 144.50 / IMI 039719) TaxID=759272 RepID=G0S628_CHATD|nr:mannan polymerase II complex ANP1 subunit-like protein [Thermochaetoides thermophila DSM 1495]EGS21536.1 mannan polymerase II complex ANP1 subunit-like protein [Thermochaetoides thermophila DSM 1495]